MTLKGRDMSFAGEKDPSSERFVHVVDNYGFTALMIELAVLAGATFAAIGTDEYWQRRAHPEATLGKDDEAGKDDEDSADGGNMDESNAAS